MITGAKNNRGIYRCGCCGEIGHTAKKHKRRRPRSSRFSTNNAAYQDNRARGLCDDCGSPSKRSRCPRCTRRRKRWPSRQPGYRKTHERRVSAAQETHT